MGTIATNFVIAGAEYAADRALAPKTPRPPPPVAMPNQSQILQGQQMAEAQAAALRRGRASTILTTNASTGDRLGP